MATEGPPLPPQHIGVIGPGNLADLNDSHDFADSHPTPHPHEGPLGKESSEKKPPEVDLGLFAQAQALLAGKT